MPFGEDAKTLYRTRGSEKLLQGLEQMTSVHASGIVYGANGVGETFQAYFPKYLLTCLQNHFLYGGESIYEQYKHVRYTIEILLEKLPQRLFKVFLTILACW